MADRWTHSIVFPVNDEVIMENIERFTQCFAKRFPQSKVESSIQHHLILFKLNIPKDSEKKAIAALKKVVLSQAGQFREVSLDLFDSVVWHEPNDNTAVVHTDVDFLGHKHKFKALFRGLQSALEQDRSILLESSNSKPLLHCPLLSLAGQPFTQSEMNFLENHSSQDFGNQQINEVQLLRNAKNDCGKWEVVSEISFSQNWSHFIAIQIDDKEILDNVELFLGEFFGKFPKSKLLEARKPKISYHLTLLMLGIPDESVGLATEIFEQAASRIAGEFQNSTMRLYDACILKTRRKKEVIYAAVDCNCLMPKIKRLLDDLKAEFSCDGFITFDERAQLLHCSILDSALIDRANPTEPPYQIPQDEYKFLENIGPRVFGTQSLNSVQLLKRGPEEMDKYYEIVSEVKFSQNI